MLLQRVFWSSWQGHIINAPSLHHVLSFRGQHKDYMHRMVRSFRSNIHHRNTLRSSRLQVTPFENSPTGGPVPPQNIFKAFVFTGTFTIGCFMGATILEYENTRSMMMQKARMAKFAWSQGRSGIEQETQWTKVKRDLKNFWDQLTPGEKVFVPICALNMVVFGLWRIPALRNTMMTYFCSNPAARAVCWPMFLSTFSHYSMFHIFANMYVLHSFSKGAVLSLGKEQFLAVYLSGGTIASMSSIFYKAITSQAGLSLGASGAIMAVLAYVCAQYPDTRLSILFLPTLTFSAGSAIKIIMGIDFAGCVLGWKFFDHAAHLGGAMFGIFWAFFGAEMWQKRLPLLTKYHDWRKTK